MFDWFKRERLETKAEPLARALRDQYGAGAVEVCRAALTRPELVGERRRVIRLTLQLLDGSISAGRSQLTELATVPVTQSL